MLAIYQAMSKPSLFRPDSRWLALRDETNDSYIFVESDCNEQACMPVESYRAAQRGQPSAVTVKPVTTRQDYPAPRSLRRAKI